MDCIALASFTHTHRKGAPPITHADFASCRQFPLANTASRRDTTEASAVPVLSAWIHHQGAAHVGSIRNCTSRVGAARRRPCSGSAGTTTHGRSANLLSLGRDRGAPGGV